MHLPELISDLAVILLTGGIVTVKDSTDNWYLSWTINRQPQFKSQDKNMVLVWLYSLNTNKEGNYVKKAMRDCTGEEVCREWLYHIGMPTEKIDALAHDACNTTTCFMPYINSFFQPRKESDRPKVVPDGAVNFAFIGQFAETPRDTIFTTEYSMRTGMEAVYTLLNVDRGVPEVWGSVYDVRDLLNATVKLRDGKKATDMEMGLVEKLAVKKVLEEMQKKPSQRILHQGKQTLHQLKQHGASLTNIEITEQNIKAFSAVAKKYDIDYALKKDPSTDPPHYYVFFKAKDKDQLQPAFKEFTAMTLNREKRPTIREKLAQTQEQSKTKHREREKVKTRDREVAR